jgi:hypothetical protein
MEGKIEKQALTASPELCMNGMFPHISEEERP